MPKGSISVAAGLTVAGLLGALVFTSIIPAVTNFISQGTGAETSQDFKDFTEGLKSVCNEDKQTATGGISEYGAHIEFTEKDVVALVRRSEIQESEELGCPVDNYDNVKLEGTMTYTIEKQGSQLIVQTRGG